jgi:hypothetical protein
MICSGWTPASLHNTSLRSRVLELGEGAVVVKDGRKSFRVLRDARKAFKLGQA